jgi:pimeloyl-ACP methyl ester carboxylesterase
MPATTTKPTVLIVPGSFSAASHYDTLVNALHALSYPAVVSDLPSASRLPPAPAASMADDAAHFHGIAESLADEGRDIVILTHSYGGVPGTEAAKGLAKADREAEGKKGGVVRLVYLTSVVPPVGGSLISTLGKVSEAITINVCVPVLLILTPLLVS